MCIRDSNNLWQNYHFLVEKFFEKVKLNKELKDLDLRKNMAVSYTHLRAHETVLDLVCRLLLEKKKK